MHLESVTNQTTQVWGDPAMSFGKRVRVLREKQGLTAKELSARCGVPEKTIYRIETGDVVDPRLSTVETLVKALQCSADEILFDIQAFDGSQRLRQLFEETSKTTKSNQELVAQLIMKLNLADRLRFEISRSEIDRYLTAPGISWQNEDGTTRPVKLEDLKLDTEMEEYFRKNPNATNDYPSED